MDLPTLLTFFMRLCIGCSKIYGDLTPAQRTKVDDIVRAGVEKALVYGLPFVLGEVGGAIAREVTSNGQVIELAKIAVKRGTEIGVDQALAEMHKS